MAFSFLFFSTQSILPTGNLIDVAIKSSASDQEAVTFAHLQAFIIQNESPPTEQLVKININANVLQTNFETLKSVRANETDWMLMKKMIVNELFGTIKLNLGFVMKSAGISKLYSLIMKRRGVEESSISRTSISERVLWFLGELSEVKPDPSIVSHYLTLHPEVNKQYFLSYLFRSTASKIRKFTELGSVLDVVQSLIIQVMINTVTEGRKIHSVEFDKFMKKYVPIILRYIIETGLNVTTKDNLDDDIFSMNEFVAADKDHVINIDPSVIFRDEEKPVSRKQTAEIASKKKGVINIEVATPPGEKSESTPKDDADESSVHKASGSDGDEGEVQLKTRINEPANFDKPIGLRELSERHGSLRDLDGLENREINDELVPNTPVEKSERLNSDEIPSKKQEPSVTKSESITDRQTVSSKHENRAHDDL